MRPDPPDAPDLEPFLLAIGSRKGRRTLYFFHETISKTNVVWERSFSQLAFGDNAFFSSFSLFGVQTRAAKFPGGLADARVALLEGVRPGLPHAHDPAADHHVSDACSSLQRWRTAPGNACRSCS